MQPYLNSHEPTSHKLTDVIGRRRWPETAYGEWTWTPLCGPNLSWLYQINSYYYTIKKHDLEVIIIFFAVPSRSSCCENYFAVHFQSSPSWNSKPGNTRCVNTLNVFMFNVSTHRLCQPSNSIPECPTTQFQDHRGRSHRQLESWYSCILNVKNSKYNYY